jgi:arginyl-tRNA synthetase
VVKSSGEPTYRLPDTAYHINKLERGFDLLINILGTDHIEEAKDVAAMVAALGYDASKIRVPLHQFVTISEGGETKRMSTRKGEFVTLDELVDDVGPDAVRYFMLARSPASHMDFDIDLARKQSNENPVYYIQNAHVRCVSIDRVATERGFTYDEGDVSLLEHPRELALIRKLLELPEIIDMVAGELEPHKLAFWAHEELARLFHPTYEEIRALHTSVPEDLARARLKLYAAARIVLARTLDLMGMSAPEQM